MENKIEQKKSLISLSVRVDSLSSAIDLDKCKDFPKTIYCLKLKKSIRTESYVKLTSWITIHHDIQYINERSKLILILIIL